ncbi:MAG: hypothetical protein H6553_11115 [Chitinophagales bacterium]|nr:hypothetical protein [Chitinophagales bacterium]
MLLLLLFLFFIRNEKLPSIQLLFESLIKAYLSSSLIVLINVELCSLFNLLNHVTLLAVYMLELLIVVVFIFPRYKNIINIIMSIVKRKKKIYFYLFLFSVFVLLFLAIFIPTTNNDSISYHMPRVFYWMQNHNVNFYPTLNGRQLFSSPFAEYLILQNTLLSNSEYYNNLPQLLAMFMSCVTVYLITIQLSNKKKTALIGMLFCFCLPMGIFQSTTTQNDYVVAAYSIILLYYILISFKEGITLSNSIFFGVALVLTGLTKFTGWILISPFLCFYGLKILFRHKIKSIKLIVITGLLTLLLLPSFYRNYNSFNNVIGPKMSEPLSVPVTMTNLSLKDGISNTIKNIAVSSAVPFAPINRISKKIVYKIHKLIVVNVNKKWNNYNNIPFSNNFIFHEDGVSNFIHLILFLFSLICLCFIKYNKLLKIYALLLVSSYLLFSILLMWQPWHNRLELPWFVILCPYLALFISEFKCFKYIIISLMIFFMIPCLLLNPSKPIINVFGKKHYQPIFFSGEDLKILKQKNATLFNAIDNSLTKNNFNGIVFYTTENDTIKNRISKEIDFNYPRSIFKKTYNERMFANDITIYHQIKNMNILIDNNTNIAMSILAGTPEYAILYSLRENKKVHQIQNIGVLSSLKNLPNATKPFEYDYLITNNFLLEKQINKNNIDSIYDFAYFRLYHFKTRQHKKYIVQDVLQDFYKEAK